MTLLTCDALTVRRGPCPVVDGVSLRVQAGEVVGLIGPNGAGKTTLMRAALGLLPHEGRSSLSDLPPEARARQAAWVPQAREIAWPVSVETLVSLGRTTPASVAHALARLDLDGFRHRPARELSGGEQARVLLARALAQDTPLLVADEPAAGLDPAHQIAAMDLFRSLAREGRGVLVSLHDLGQATRVCDRLILLARGGLVAEGRPEEVLTEARLAEVFGITVWRGESPSGPILYPIGLTEPAR